MEKEYFTCAFGPILKGPVDTAFEDFIDNTRNKIAPIEILVNQRITEERFNLLRQVTLIDTPTLKRLLKL